MAAVLQGNLLGVADFPCFLLLHAEGFGHRVDTLDIMISTT
jgi:hypothetical protein